MRWITIFATFVLPPVFSQPASTIPIWLESYPGAKPGVRSLTESSYTTAAQPDDIVEHYRKLFQAAGVSFQPNPDGVGTSIRADAHECELLIQIRTRAEGSFVDVNCSVKSESPSPSFPTDVKVTTSRPQPVRSTASAPAVQSHTGSVDFMQMHQQKVAEMGLHRQYHDAPAPPLVWPSWLVNVNGAAVRAEPGVDQAKNPILRARYTTNAPMTEIYSFYREMLTAHEYPTRSSMTTGHTMTGVMQNALGYVEGSNYPDGAPGAYSEIHVSFDRDVLNGPITVSLRFSTHEFIAKRGY
jgi:hypothetical protein